MRRWYQLELSEKISLIIFGFIILTLLISIPFAIYERNWMALFVGGLTLFLVFLPRILEDRWGIKFIPEFHIAIIVFIYAGLFLGEVRGYYTKIWWWDSVLHAFSGVALGFAGFLILYILYKSGKFRASFKLLAFFAFLFAVALGALWEIFEFGADSLFGANMQKARGLAGDSRMGVMDTMWDMILNTGGALVASLAGYFYLKKKEMFLIKTLVEKFEKSNISLFKKKRPPRKKGRKEEEVEE